MIRINRSILGYLLQNFGTHHPYGNGGHRHHHYGPGYHSLVPYWMQRTMAHPGLGMTGPETGMSEVLNDKDKFQINLDVSHFSPEGIKVTVGGSCCRVVLLPATRCRWKGLSRF